jgi:CheY-like chemotaxis protein
MHNPPLILIVDDTPEFREILATKLKANGYWVAEAVNGAEGVERAASLQPDLILMDINMPNANGTEAVLDLKQDDETKNLRVIFLSSLKSPWPFIKSNRPDFAKELGAMDFIDKSEDLDKVLEKVRNTLASIVTKTA